MVVAASLFAHSNKEYCWPGIWIVTE